jgi:serine/threonine-protein kinase RsbT
MKAMETISIRIVSETDIFFIQNELMKVMVPIGFGLVDQNKIKTIVSELAYNIIKYAKRGSIKISQIEEGGKKGVIIKATDRGPGIIDINNALQDNYSTGGTLGLGLPGIKRMAGNLKVESNPDEGTKVIVKYWIN